MTTPTSKISQAPRQATTTQVLPTPTPFQVIDGPITHSRAKKLQQKVHTLLREIHFNINENYILPKCCTLTVLRYIEEEKDESDPEERTSASPRRQTSKMDQESKKWTSGVKLFVVSVPLPVAWSHPTFVRYKASYPQFTTSYPCSFDLLS